jgi:hypothetical protein
MPKENIDYSNTIIYKICCKDETIQDLYVGHTTNFIQRKYLHKTACNNINATAKIYNTIRSNGSWENWDMIEIAKYCCKDSTEARIKEQYHYNELKSTLNSVPPYIDKTLYFCSNCNLQCSNPKQYNAHILSNKHIKNINDNDNDNKTSKNIKNFSCIECNFSCLKKGDWNRHIMRPKHIMLTTTNTNDIKNISKNVCDICNKEYKSRNGLWNHKKKCIVNSNVDNSIQSVLTDRELVLALIKDNNDLKNMLLHVINIITKEHNTNN